jgi:hypothetical protein
MIWLAGLTLTCLCSAVQISVQSDSAAGASDLKEGFANPPASAHPGVFWEWMDGNITAEGITKDLEALKQAGISSAMIFNIGQNLSVNVPSGPVRFFSQEWREMMTHAIREADRLNLKLGMHNCAGWTSSGGPWIEPENAMQRLTISETTIAGPSHFSGLLPQPETSLGFYQDIDVLAFPEPAGEGRTLRSLLPKATLSLGGFDAERSFDGNQDTSAVLPFSAEEQRPFIQFVFSQPQTIRSVRLFLGPGCDGAPKGTVQISDDGETFRDLQAFEVPFDGGNGTLSVSLGNNPPAARFYRITFKPKASGNRQIVLSEIVLSPALCTGDIYAKSGMNRGFLNGIPFADTSPLPSGFAVESGSITNLTRKMTADGRLEWDVPAGKWVVLRIGYTPTGRENHPAAAGGKGLECDKLSSKGIEAHWNGFIQPVLDDAGSLAGKTLTTLLIDSYEAGGQNWTANFSEEFRRLRGYDIQPWLVSITGRVVDSPDSTERFLRDMRRTIADLFAENYYARFSELCHRHDLKAAIEPYAGTFESLQSGASADIPMGEFWTRDGISPWLKLVASIGHVQSRPIIAAEAFTAAPDAEHGRWQEDPYSLKAVGDQAFCQGINRFIIHRCTLQPWLNRRPGMTMGRWGVHFDRTSTWWKQSVVWTKYLARSQFLLQQGHFVADAAVFMGENPPVTFLPPINPGIPAGYDYDVINADVLFNQAEVQDGRLVLKNGMTTYSTLIFSMQERTMTPELLGKLHDFVRAGLTLVGPPPEQSPSLAGSAQSEAIIKSLSDEMWGDCNGTTITDHPFGRGRVIWGKSLRQVFDDLNIKPDFECYSAGETSLNYIHRQDGNADIYFISNQRQQFDEVSCTFRVSGKVPELWHPDTGEIEDAPVWQEENGRTTVPLQFDSSGSVFVIFQRDASGSDPIISADFSDSPIPGSDGLMIQSARYEAVDNSALSRDVTARLTDQIFKGHLEVLVNNTTLGGDPAPFHHKQLCVNYILGGQKREKIVAERQLLKMGVPFIKQPSALSLTRLENGTLEVSASAPGDADLMFASGKCVSLHMPHVPALIELTNPWLVMFPPGWGAPAQITLPQLVSWTESSDEGVKYFSGTAIYHKEIELPADIAGSDLKVYLNLGKVRNLAEVIVNGNDLGVLWKPPFRVDISDAIRPGKNSLEIKVTNLWPNRLIGDEQLPADCEWKGTGAINAWPQWLLNGEPSPTGRFTFTTWHHWKRDDELLPSGLLGPVTIQFRKKIYIP